MKYLKFDLSTEGLIKALPFWISYALIPIAWISAVFGGWFIFLLPLLTWFLFSILDAFLGLQNANEDPLKDDKKLGLYQLTTILWAPIQFLTIFGILFFISSKNHLTGAEQLGLFFGLGIISGTVGINYSHELMHQSSKLERWMADFLLAMVLYSHFRSEHLLVHHRHVCTPKDAVTARFNESFYKYFPRVLWQCFFSAINAERDMLKRAKRRFWSYNNPFIRYLVLQILFLALAFWIGGFWGLGLFAIQAFIAVWQLELVDYIEHYGLTRKYLGNGKYEHVFPRHSWNAAHMASNWLLINLQRHSDHHFKPDRPFPLLQTYSNELAPQLPFSYPIMTIIAMIPPIFKKIMNHRVKEWRLFHYPDIDDWTTYETT